MVKLKPIMVNCSRCQKKAVIENEEHLGEWKSLVIVVRSPGEAQFQHFVSLCADCTKDLFLSENIAAKVGAVAVAAVLMADSKREVG